MKRNLIWLIGFYLLLSVVLILNNINTTMHYDDAYVHFRVVENFINAGVPYYNIDEMLKSSSSTAWTILLYFLFKVFGIQLHLVSIINALFVVAGVFVYSSIVKKITQKSGIKYDLLTAVCYVPFIQEVSLGLMETPLAILITGIAIYLFFSKNSWAFFFFGIAVFVRPEVVVFGGIFFVYNLFAREVSIKKSLLFGLIGSLPFVLFDLYYYHTLIPHAVIAKSIVYDIKLDFILKLFTQPFFFKIIFWKDSRIFEFCLFILTAITGCLLQLKYIEKLKSTKSLLFTMPAVLLLFLYIVKHTHIFPWYTPLVTIFLSLGVLISIINLDIKTRKSKGLLIIFILILIPYIKLFGLCITNGLKLRANLLKPAHLTRVGQYLNVSSKLYKLYPNETLLTSEVGALGYGFKGKIFDGLGLISPQALKYHPMEVPKERIDGAIGAIPYEVIPEIKPGMIVSYDIFIVSLIKNNYPYIKDNYVRILNPSYKKNYRYGDYLNIYIRKDIFNKEEFIRVFYNR